MKSPLKDKALNNPGETLERHIEEYRDKYLLEPLLGIVLIVVMTITEWVRWYFDSPPNPLAITLFAIVGTGYFSWKIVRARKNIRPLRQGLEGEKVVGQFLERMRESGAKVFHDIPGQGFNIDHVVIHKNGIYVIETKTFSKPEKGNSVIKYDGESLCFPGQTTTTEQLIQTKAASTWLQELFLESTGSKFVTKPVLVFPGWYIESSPAALNSDVWVLNPKALPAFIKNQKQQLAEDKVHMLALHLSRYVRSYKS